MNRNSLNTVRAERAALRNAPASPLGSTSINRHATDIRTARAPSVAPEVYTLVSIERTSAPARAAGDDWLVYRIGRGANVITGYRRGTRASVTVDIEKIAQAFNERRFAQPRRVSLKLGRKPLPNPARRRDKDLV